MDDDTGTVSTISHLVLSRLDVTLHPHTYIDLFRTIGWLHKAKKHIDSNPL